MIQMDADNQQGLDSNSGCGVVLAGDARDVLSIMAEGSIQCVMTSPPYFGLRDYGGPDLVWNDGWVGQLGLEPTPTMYVNHLVEVMSAVWRVLRDDGCLWLNLGDSYAGSWGNQGRKAERGVQRPINGEMLTPVLDGRYPDAGRNTGAIPPGADYKAKDLFGIPWMVAFALRDAGWYLRSDVIWRKPNPMPSSVRDRPTSAHEYVFLLTKSKRYHYDWLAAVEPFADARMGRDSASIKSGYTKPNDVDPSANGGKNRRTVWTVPEDLWSQFVAWLDAQDDGAPDVWDVSPKPYKEAHFAVFPPALARIALLAGTSPVACAECGAPYRRDMSDKVAVDGAQRSGNGFDRGGVRLGQGEGDAHVYAPSTRETIGFSPSCDHASPGRCVVLDPFSGASSTGLAAAELGLDYVGVEVVDDYVELARRRLSS
jgi:DNA modification methylase